jgi:excinuclease ABC subunit C
MYLIELKEKVRKIPESPGIYLMKNYLGEIIYVGKAKNLRVRLSWYFRNDCNHSLKTLKMIEQIHDFCYILTNSEQKALLLECEFIKKYSPKYNILLKDDRGFNYLKVTYSDFGWPKIEYVSRKDDNFGKYFGPFIGFNVIKIFYKVCFIFKISTCKRKFYDINEIESCSSLIKNQKPCLNFYIKRCSAPCAGKILKEEYLERFKNVLDFFENGSTKVIEKLTNNMLEASNSNNFEKAAATRDIINNILKINDNKNINIEKRENDYLKISNYFSNILKTKKEIKYIESYDISHLQGRENVGAMVVFEKGEMLKSNYRKFKISFNLNDDYNSIKEICRRRFDRITSTDKAFSRIPDLILVDGGPSQVRAAYEIIDGLNLEIPILGMVKNAQHKTCALADKQHKIDPDDCSLDFVKKIQDETHRFTINYHRKLRDKKFLC